MREKSSKEQVKPKRYPIKCPNCDAQLYCEKSIFHLMGYPSGHGSCIECGKMMAILFDKEKDEMSTKDWDIYVDELKKEEEKAKLTAVSVGKDEKN